MASEENFLITKKPELLQVYEYNYETGEAKIMKDKTNIDTDKNISNEEMIEIALKELERNRVVFYGDKENEMVRVLKVYDGTVLSCELLKR